jgi:hypothetical protein
VTPPKIAAYGGPTRPSELRSYEAGEGLTLETQDDGYVVAWSAHVTAEEFMRAVQSLVAKATAEVSPLTNGHGGIPLDQAMTIVAEHPQEATFIKVAADDESFSWEAADPSAKGPYPEVPGEVGVMFSALNNQLVERMIESTATPHVQEDIAGILDSAQHLTRSTPTASTSK